MGREYEKKFLSEVQSYQATVSVVRDTLISRANSFNEGTSIDAYWKPASEAKGSFIRLRVSNDGSVTMTSKVDDKNDVTDRKEFNVPIAEAYKDDAMEALTAALGEPTAIMWRWVDFKIDNEGATISVIQNLDKPIFTFLEVECQYPEQIDRWVKLLDKLTLKQVKNSFYDIFALGNGVRL